jgi:predicted Fe-Mo cluster-binding NifX family protein
MKVYIPTEREACIDVLVGAEGTVRNAIEAWQQGRLMEATDENPCKEHRDH